MTESRVTPDGEKQWRSADGNWYPTESAALLAGLQPIERVVELTPPSTSPLPSPVAPAPHPPTLVKASAKRGPVGISLPDAAYLGGHPCQKYRVDGYLIVRDGIMGIGIMRRVPRLAKIVLSPGLPMRVESAVISKSRGEKILAFGVVGLAGRDQQDAAYVTADMGGGLAVTYQVTGMTGPELAARLRGPLGAYEVRI